jgi:hypothetical protein
MEEFALWRDRNERDLRTDDIRVDWGRSSDGGDYWEVWVREDV